MALLIGKDYAPYTWAGLRSVIFNYNLPDQNILQSEHSFWLEHGFKTSNGNGFVRTDYTALYLNSFRIPFGSGNPYAGPNFFVYGVDVPSPGIDYSYFASQPGGATDESPFVNEDRLQFVGQPAVVNSFSFTIANTAFIPPDYQEITSYAYPATINSIGNLTPF
jgi:hypothetical protein